MNTSSVKFCVILTVFILSVCHLFFGNCQTTKYHYFFQTKYLKKDPGYPKNYVGRWKVWDDELRLFLEFEIKNNQYNGIFKEYYSNGSIKEKCNYADNKLQGEQVIYFENGTIRQRQFFLGGGRNGKCIEWYSNGELKQIVNYKDDKWSGQSIYFYENGVVSGVFKMEDILTTGDYLRFHKNGQLESRINYEEFEKKWYQYKYNDKGEFIERIPVK